MNIFHTVIFKVASIISAIFLFLGPGTPQTTVVDVGDGSVVTSTTTQESQPQSVAGFLVPTVSQDATASPTPTVSSETASSAPQTVPEVTKTVYVPVYIIQPQASAPQSAPTATVSAPAIVTPMELVKIEIKSPINGKGLERDLKWRAEPYDETNQILIGAVLYNPDGSVNNTAQMEVTTSDPAQDKSMAGTGVLGTFGDTSNPKYYYPFSYAFKTAGLHTITFAALGVQEKVDIEVTDEDTRPLTPSE